MRIKAITISVLALACMMPAVGCITAKAEAGTGVSIETETEAAAEISAKAGTGAKTAVKSGTDAGTGVRVIFLGEDNNSSGSGAGPGADADPGADANPGASDAGIDKSGSEAKAVPDEAGINTFTGSANSYTEDSGLQVERINVPQTASVLITLAGERNSDSSVLNLYLREHDADGNVRSPWTLRLSTPAKNGRKGLYKEIMGDLKTPVGIFLMNTPFGIGDAMEGFPADYIKVDDSLYWNGDPESPSYNKMVDTDEFRDFDKGLSEHLINYGGYYDYCIDTGYNYDGTPYKGSAIFLHCMVNNGNTAGCIAVPEDVMIEIMRLYRGGSTYIAIYDKADIEAMY